MSITTNVSLTRKVQMISESQALANIIVHLPQFEYIQLFQVVMDNLQSIIQLTNLVSPIAVSKQCRWNQGGNKSIIARPSRFLDLLPAVNAKALLPCGLGLGPPVCRREEIPPQSRMSSNSKSAGVDSFRAGRIRLS